MEPRLIIAKSPQKIFCNEERVITLNNGMHANSNGQNFSGNLVHHALPVHSLGWCMAKPGQGPYMVHPTPGMVALSPPPPPPPPHSPPLSYTLPGNRYCHNQQQLAQGPCYPAAPHTLVGGTPAVNDGTGIVADLDRSRRMKRTRATSLSSREQSAVFEDDSGDADNDSLDEPPIPRQSFHQLRHQSLPDNFFEEGVQDFRRFSSRLKRKTSFYGVSLGETKKGESFGSSGLLERRGRLRNMSGTSGTVRPLHHNSERSLPVSVPLPALSGYVSAPRGSAVDGQGRRCSKRAKYGDVERKEEEVVEMKEKEMVERKEEEMEERKEEEVVEMKEEEVVEMKEKEVVEMKEKEVVEISHNSSNSGAVLGKQTSSKEIEPASTLYAGEMKKVFCINRLVWGKLPGYSWWPGAIISHEKAKELDQDMMAATEGDKMNKDSLERSPGSEVTSVWIKWFGENQLSLVPLDKMALIEEFGKYFNPSSMKGTYRKAIVAVVKEAAKRCSMTFKSDPGDKDYHWVVLDSSAYLVPSLDPPFPDTSQPEPTSRDASCVGEAGAAGNAEEGKSKEDEEPLGSNNSNMNNNNNNSSSNNISGSSTKGSATRIVKKGKSKGEMFISSYERELLEWALKGFLPRGPLGGLIPTKMEQEEKAKVVEDEKTMKVLILKDNQNGSKANFDSVREGRLDIEDICVGCGDMRIVGCHPLFHGGLCQVCKKNFMECAYMFDEDGSQMYCTICSGGNEVFICDGDNCAKVICQPCIEKLCGSEEVERVHASSTWLCYMCSPTHSRVGLLAKRDNWDVCLRELFTNDYEMEFEPPPIPPPVPPELRKPLRVLGLFDGIGTGYVVLKELGLEVECYVSSEVDMSAINVSRAHHPDIIHVGDVCGITEKEVRAWSPFDLVIGGSPCNDLSIVNPARKGIYEGTGRLFFEFFRILSIAKPRPDEERPFFWLFENVTSMNASDKQVISRFLQCNPVVVDAKDISPTHRARYFWGNLPGMNRPVVPLPSDRLTLQECLEPHCFRQAQFAKLRTITTKMNSIKQNGGSTNPVMVKGFEDKEDILWSTELEQLFGFPKHYTDVGNLGRQGRQRLLGKAWSVPVIRHLLAPLKDYFMSNKPRETAKNSSPAVSQE